MTLIKCSAVAKVAKKRHKKEKERRRQSERESEKGRERRRQRIEEASAASHSYAAYADNVIKQAVSKRPHRPHSTLRSTHCRWPFFLLLLAIVSLT